ncbi:hypothetical protein HH212_19535 [Massilia forsythiae]|uniref:Sel1 repeat family protein n=1 Tax=Massilia forsythiae TaxID=2728020 RepID=A0A7Z2VZW8_9BURK|nr:SEL1-like repeat protein [Massilia forsythiae]QJE01942.1 hypothetical protein HH212_19535 [Massilia forsythiae]
MTPSMHRTRLALVIAALGALPLPGLAQAQMAAAPTTAPAAAEQTAAAQGAASVVIKGARGGATQADTVIAAKSRVLSRKYASSCAFMSSPNAAEDDVALAYMADFGMEDSISNDAPRYSDLAPDGDAANSNGAAGDPRRFSDRAPDGDVSNARLPSSIGAIPGAPDPNAPSVKCGAGDRRFAAGRNAILRKDKSLAQGFEALDRRDYARALALLTAAYKKIGYDEAALALAKMHLYGMGTPRDTGEAVRWLRLVADGRFDPASDGLRFDPKEPQFMTEKVEAAFMLARIHERGIGIKPDPDQARKWYARAADFGFVPARDILGQAWLAGYGGPRDARKGQAYLQDAARAGYVSAQYNLARLYYRGDGSGDGAVPRDLKQAGAWFDAAARAGHPGALFAAGRMFDLGEGVPADPKRAIVYYKEAALKGNGDAEFALGTFFYEGEQVPKNLDTARKLFDAAARQGQADAMFSLGAMAANGEGGPADQAMAWVWFSLAKAAGHAGADAALKALAPKLTAQDRAKADAILKPAAKS